MGNRNIEMSNMIQKSLFVSICALDRELINSFIKRDRETETDNNYMIRTN